MNIDVIEIFSLFHDSYFSWLYGLYQYFNCGGRR